MWHPIGRVVIERNLDPTCALYVALEKTDQFGIIIDDMGTMKINTWYVDAFVSAVRCFKNEVDGKGELI